MTIHEQTERPEFGGSAIDAELERYFVDISVACPYGLAQRAVYHQALFPAIDDETMGRLLANGYRRNGNCVYAMRCPACQDCVPIRLRPDEFRPDRNQRRVWKKNSDVRAGVAPPAMTRENLALLDRFLRTRFPESRSTAEEYYAGFFITSISRCFEIRYRVKDRLIGVAIVDGSSRWLNAVYFYFDPDEGWRSPGTMNILYLINFCRGHKIDFFYLGYWIEQVGAMRYKAAFHPHELFIDHSWQRVCR